MTRRADEAPVPPRLIDARGLKCPWPVLRAARAMRECTAIALLADDPVARVDVPALAQARGWRIVIGDEGGFQRYVLERSAPDIAPDSGAR